MATEFGQRGRASNCWVVIIIPPPDWEVGLTNGGQNPGFCFVVKLLECYERHLESAGTDGRVWTEPLP